MIKIHKDSKWLNTNGDGDIMIYNKKYNDKTKMGWYRNLTTIINYDDVLNTDLKLQILKDNAKYDSVISNCYLDFTKKNKYAYHYYAIEIINKIWLK